MSVVEYLNQCGVQALCEKSAAQTPPTANEVKLLISYLRGQGVNPVIVGSVGVFHHLRATTRDYRPTVDLDLFIDKPLPAPPEGWRKDPEAGIDSWISPSGGYVDFLLRGHQFPSGEQYPDTVTVHHKSTADFPVASVEDLLRMKLNTMREKDLSDAIALVRTLGSIPDLKRLNKLQRENFGLVKQWFQARPHGKYGE